jgi:hypothetical protein
MRFDELAFPSKMGTDELGVLSKTGELEFGFTVSNCAWSSVETLGAMRTTQ